MTGNELYQTVLQLGYADSLDDLEGLFYQGANLAMAKLSRIFPLTARQEVTLSPAAGYHIPLAGRSLDPRFLAFSVTPLRRLGQPLTPGRDYVQEEGVLMVAPHLAGVPLAVFYQVTPLRLTPDNMDDPLSVSPYGEPLLPLAVAALVWGESAPDLADKYDALYRRERAEAVAGRRAATPPILGAGNGWDVG